jgi:hypothetical protein
MKGSFQRALLIREEKKAQLVKSSAGQPAIIHEDKRKQVH